MGLGAFILLHALVVGPEAVCRVGQNHIYTRCIYGIFGRELTKYMVTYGAYIRFWPTLAICGDVFLSSGVCGASRAGVCGCGHYGLQLVCLGLARIVYKHRT
jgi:hypothetical protein